MAEVKLNNISKEYDNGKPVVNNINLEIKDKEFLVLVGPSGCGKSTTLRMIAGLEEITNGEIYIDQKLVNNVLPKDRDIAMVFQNYALYPHMTVYENLAFGLKLRKYKKEEIDKRVKEAAKILEIEEFLNRKPKALSGGQKQRVAVGRALVRKPKVFLFDEPLSNLDAKLRVQMRTEISKLHHKLNITMIYVTHDQTEAMTMGDKIVVMKDGEIQQVDSPINLYNYPVNKFVAGFIGSPAMNFIEGFINDTDKLQFISKGKSLKLDLPQHSSAKLSNYKNTEVILGLRPEDIQLHKNEDRFHHFRARLNVVEPLGNEMFIYFDIDDTQFVGRIPTSFNLKANDEVDLSLNLSKLHFFDKQTEKVI